MWVEILHRYSFFRVKAPTMFTKIIKGLEQNLSIICVDSIQQLFRKTPQNIVIPRKTLIAGFHFGKFGCCEPTTFPETTTTVFFFEVWQIFFRIDIKNNSWWIAQKILSKTFKQVLYRRRVQGQELQWNGKRNQSEPLQVLYFLDIYMIVWCFCLNDVPMERC